MAKVDGKPSFGNKEENSASFANSIQSVAAIVEKDSGLKTTESNEIYAAGVDKNAVGEEPTVDGADRDLMGKFLTFRTACVEAEFSNYFYSENNLRWKKTVSLVFGILTSLYVYLISRNTLESTEWTLKYKPELKIGTLVCPIGWYCAQCNPDMICVNYDPVMDVSFWFVLVLIPFVAALSAYYTGMAQNFAENINKVTSALVFVQIFGGVGCRYYFIEGRRNFLEPTILMCVILALIFIGTRTRFVYTLCTAMAITPLWTIMTFIAWAISADAYRGSAYMIGILCLGCTSFIVSFASYETEHFYRNQFLMGKEMKKNNAKLKNQLNLLAKSYNQQAVKSLDSPLERSMMVIRSVMADPSLYSRHLLALGQVTALLASSNLLTPDLEGNLADTMDNEQQAWLFSEIAARKRKGRGKSNIRRRQTLMLDVAQKVGNSTIRESDEPTAGGARLGSSTQNIEDGHTSVGYVPEDARAEYPPKFDEITQILENYNNYNFDLFDLYDKTSNRALRVLSHHLFAEANLFEIFVIPLDKFGNYINAIEKGYHADLPYHNSLHAADVLHCMHTLAHTTKLKEIWSDLELFGMYFAAIIHDHDHPGFTNNFLVTTSDPKAVLYNDKAVLENHHSASSFQCLAKPENNFLAHLSKAEFKLIREIVVDLVLATDLTQHFTLLSMFKSKVASPESFDPYEVREDRMLLFKIMIKCSDVSNPTKDLTIYKPWCRLIMSEFMMQGDQEKKLNIPVSPYMDRESVNVASCQIGFIDYVVQPLFGALDSYQPLPAILNKLAKNREYWGNLKLQGVLNIPEEKGESALPKHGSISSSSKHVILDISTTKD